MGKVTDPALLAQLESGGGKVTDPDLLAHLEGAQPQPQPVGAASAAISGGLQGATLGFGDELEAGWKSLFPKSMGGSDYKTTRDMLRARNAAAEQQHPLAYGAANVIGGALPALTAGAVGGVASALPMAIGQGAAQGAGYSNARTPGELARDSLVGGGVGAAGYGLGSLLGRATGAVARFARGKATQAVAKAGQQAADEVAGNIASAAGKYGGLRQTENKAILSLLDHEKNGLLDPANRASLAALKQSGRVAEAVNESAANELEFLGSRIPEVASAKGDMNTLQKGASQALAARKADLLSTGEMKRQILTRALRYGPVAAGTLLGNLVGGPVGGTVGALAGAGSRPMVRSVMRMSSNPAVQKSAAEWLLNRAEGPTATFLKQAVARGAPALATQQLVTQ